MKKILWKNVMSVIMTAVLTVLIVLGFKEGIGKTAIVSMESNSSTGCSWSYTLTKDDVFTVEKQFYVADILSGGVTGSGGKEYFVFKAKKEGTAVFEAVYKRAGSEEIYNEICYAVTVDENLNIHVEKTEKN